MKKTSQKRTAVIAAAVAVICVALAIACWCFFRPQAQAGGKEIAINVTHSDGSVKSFEISTDAAYLYEAQEPEGILQGEDSEYGLFVTAVDGEAADESAGEYWMYDVNGEPAQYGVESQPVADGDVVDFYFYVYEG